MKRSICYWMIFSSAFANIIGQVNPQTIAEKSDFKSTSNYNDVRTFIDQLRKSSHNIRIETLATTTEGREVPLLIIGNPLPVSPKDLINNKRIVVYIQADIHAGEVEGKEATLMYVRDLLKEKNPEILRNVVLLVCPLFNPDGNEKINPLNRTYQNGPVNGVGVRYNGQFLDLNRDAMKAESPEVRGVLSNVFNKWDPAVFMDCHTTDGSYHVEPTTFTWMVNPDGDNSLIAYMREKMMPEMSRTLAEKYKIENCFYGEFFDMMNPEKGWVLDASEPRYIVNYFGIRNRLGILNENYVYADFKSRVMGCYYLIHSLMEYTSNHKSEIESMINSADKRTLTRGENPAVSDSFAIEYKVRPVSDKVTIRTYEAELISETSGRKSYRRTERQKDVTVPYYIDYYPTKNVRFPFAYLLTTSDPSITDLLKRHGIKLEKLSSDSKLEVQQFEITDLKGAVRLNQGHYTNTINGKFISTPVDFPAGTIVVRTAQPLGNLAAYLLEPQSNDGLVFWNFFDRCLVPQWGIGYNPYPVYKVLDRIDLKTSEFK
ncbi:MAG: M14 family metallopeptidase [Bacteroidales bacterium]